MPAWPGGARGALCLSFDNLGVDEASSVAGTLPGLLEKLAERGPAATFFVEGVNAELAPDALREISAHGHEVAYHAWRHEQWDDLSAEEQAENLADGLSAFSTLGIELAGLRPPGGRLGPGGIEILHAAGLHYVSPAGNGASAEDGVALLPFQWRHVDATALLPGLDPVRELMTGAADQLDADTFVAYLIDQIADLERDGGFISIVLHLPLLEWLGEQNLIAIVDRLSSSEAWVARCDEIAAHVLSSSEEFAGETTLDPTSWAQPT